ncbi:MAG TPA: iron ABC transporter permease [Alphaproteobacteria bacterium]|jgi:iron(III) transport system permease protein
MTEVPMGRPGYAWPRLPALPYSKIFMILLIGVMAFLVVYPLILILINSFNEASIVEAPRYGIQAWRNAFAEPGVWQAVWNTLKVAVVRQAITFPLGVMIAWILARTNIPFSRGFEFLFWVSFMYPTVATVFGWMLLLDPDTGLVNMLFKDAFGTAPFNIYSFWGIIWVHVISGIDTKVMLLTPVFRRMDSSMEEASRMSGAGTFRTMMGVTLPLMTPALIVVMMLSLVRLFESFEVEYLLGAPWGFFVLSTKIVDLSRMEPPMINQAASLGAFVLVFLAILIPLQRWLINRRQFTTVNSQMKPKPIDVGFWRWVFAGGIVLIMSMSVVVPILSVMGGAFMVRFGFFHLPTVWTLEYWRNALTNDGLISALENTLIVAGSAAVIGTIIFSLIAYILVRTKLPGRGTLDAICWLPAAIPGVLLGLGLLWMFLGTPVFRPFYGSIGLLVVASIIGSVTLSTQILKASFIQLGNQLEEASRMSGAGFVRTYLKIVVPLMAQTLILTAVLKFLFAARNASTLIFLSTSETRPLSVLALDQIAAGNQEEASITVFLIILLTTGLAIVARMFGLRVGLREK